MENIQTMFYNFQQLSHENKLKKVISMLEKIKGVSKISSNILTLIKQRSDKIDDEILGEIYMNIINLGSNLENLEKEENQKKLASTMNKLQAIQEREKRERIREKGELDMMLSQLENIKN